MAIIIDSNSTSTIEFKDFIDVVDNEFDVKSVDGLAAIAPLFKALANDKTLVSNFMNAAIKRLVDTPWAISYTPNSIVLGRGKDFFVRANIWAPLKIVGKFRSYEEKMSSYGAAHDHNFMFMTVGYFGSGYETDTYRYDPSQVTGYIGEKVDLV